MTKARRIVLLAAFITLTVGTLNSVIQKKRWPSSRFLIGNGVLFFGISSLAEFEPEVANNLALAVMVFAILGEGGGVLKHIGADQELDTGNQHPQTAAAPRRPAPHGQAQFRAVKRPNQRPFVTFPGLGLTYP